jgi:hypothetical protein
MGIRTKIEACLQIFYCRQFYKGMTVEEKEVLMVFSFLQKHIICFLVPINEVPRFIKYECIIIHWSTGKYKFLSQKSCIIYSAFRLNGP